MYLEMSEVVTHVKSRLVRERPKTWKELQQKYTEEELQDLVSTGGITQCPHSKNGRVTMWIDHSDWEKTSLSSKSKSLGSKRQKMEFEREEQEGFQSLLDSFVDFDPATMEKVFLKDLQQAMGSEEDLNTVPTRQSTHNDLL